MRGQVQPWTVGIAPAGAALIVLNAAPIALALILANLLGRPTAGGFALRRPPLARAIGLLVAVWSGLTALTVLWVAALASTVRRGLRR